MDTDLSYSSYIKVLSFCSADSNRYCQDSCNYSVGRGQLWKKEYNGPSQPTD